MRRLFVTLALGLTLVWAACMALTSPRTAAALRPWLSAQLTLRLGHAFTVDRLELGAFPPRVTAWDVALGDNDSPLRLQARCVQLSPAVLRSLVGRPVLASAQVLGLVARVRLQDLPHNAAGAQPSGDPWPWRKPWPIDVLDADVTDADVQVTDGNRTLRGRGLSLRVGPYHWGHRAITLDASGCTLQDTRLFGLQPRPMQLTGEAQLHGHLHRPKVLSLGLVRAQLGPVTLDASGDLDIDGRAPASRSRLTLHTPLPELPELLVGWPAWAGVLDLQVAVDRPFGDVHAEVSGTVAQAGHAGGPVVGDVSFVGQLHGRELRLERLALEAAGQTRAVADGTLQLAHPRAFDGNVALLGLELATLWEGLAGKTGPLAGSLTGRVQAHGSLWPTAAVHGSWQVQAAPLTVLGRQTDHGPLALLAVPSLQVLGHTDSTLKATVLHNVEVRAGGSLLTVDGAIEHHRRTGRQSGPYVQARLWGGGFDLRDLGPIANTPYRGTAGVGGTLTGPLLRPGIRGHAQVAGFGIGPLELGDCEATVVLAVPTLILEQLTVAQAGGTLTGTLALDFVPPTLQLRTALEADGIDVGQLAQTIGLPRGIARQFSGALYGPVQVSGPLLRPVGSATLATPMLTVGPLAVGAAALQVRFGEGDERVALTARSEPLGGTLTSHIIWRDQGGLSLDATGRKLPLTLWPAAVTAGITGTAALQVNMEGLGIKPVGGATLNIDDVAVGGQAQGGAHAVARLQGSELQGSVSMLHGGLHATGTLNTTGAMLGTVHGGLDALNLATFVPLLAPQGGAATAATVAGLSAVITGTGTLSGPFARAQELQVSAHLAALQLGWRGANMKLRRPADIAVRGGLVQMSPILLQGPQLNLRLTGKVPTAMQDPRLDGMVEAQGDLGALAAFSRGIDAGQGPFAAQVSLKGTLEAPRMTGEASVRKGTLRLSGQDKALEHIEGRLVFTGRTAALTGGRATLGEGRLTLAGEANVGSGSWQDPMGMLSLRLHLRHVPLRPANDVDAVLSGNLELTGGLLDNALRGDLTLDALRYTARIDLDKLVPKRAAPPLRAPMMPAGRATRLSVHMRAPGNLLISSPVLEAELAADLTVTGTTDRVGLIGHVTPLWARARWHDNLFVLTRSSIDFVDEYRVAPQFNVVARTRACQMDADVQIQGSIEGISVTPSGRDERGPVNPQDVLTCLQFGLRLRDFDGNQKSGATAGALSSGLDALWTVSGLDAKVRKFLPIAVDELRLTSAWSSNAQRTTPRVLVAKELGHHVALRYQRSIDEFNDQAFNLEYKVAHNVALSAGWLTARDVDIGDFGLDLRLHWSLR